MAQLDGGYEAGNETMGDSDALPAGEYVAALVKSDPKDAKSGNGNRYINCEFEVQDGEFQGRRFWTLLNLWNSNPTAVDIAQRELNSIMHACGKLRVSDTEELHGIPMIVRLSIKTDAKYGDKNEVKSYKPMNGAAPRQSGGQQASGAPASRPWGNRGAA